MGSTWHMEKYSGKGHSIEKKAQEGSFPSEEVNPVDLDNVDPENPKGETIFTRKMILSRQCCLVALVAALTLPLGPHPFPLHIISLRLRLWLPCLPHPLFLFLNIILSLTIAGHRPLRSVSTLMQDYLTARLCEGCGDLCVERLVRGVRDINLITSNVLELPIWLHDCIKLRFVRRSCKRMKT